MNTVLLTAAERARFADWLEQEAANSRELIPQLVRLVEARPMVDREKREAAAALVIAAKLRGTETL